MAERERAGRGLQALLSPRSVAIVGDSPRPSRGAATHVQLIGQGFAGSLLPVNPRYEQVRGLPCYPDLSSLPLVPDLVVVATPAPTVLEIVQNCAQLGVSAVTVLGSGFAEAGPDGAELQQRVTDAARGGGIALCGPNCYGVANLLDRVVAGSLPLPLGIESGALAFVLQSGALSHGMIDFAVRRRTGIGYVVTAGNEAVLDVADYLAALAGDERVRSVACYIEAIRRPRPLLEAIEQLVAAGTAVAVLKSGRSEPGRRATAAHTGAVADDERVWSALLRSAGAQRVRDLTSLVECAVLSLSIRAGTRTHPFLMSFSGAAASVMADLAVDAGLRLSDPDHETAQRIVSLLPEGSAVANPLDLTGFIADQPERIGEITAALDGAAGGLLPVMVLNSPAAVSPADRQLYLSTVDALNGAWRPPLVGSMLPGDVDEEILARCRQHGMAFVAGMETIVAVLAARQSASDGRASFLRARSSSSAAVGEELRSAVRCWLAAVGGGMIGEGRAKEALELAGVATPARREVVSAAEASAAASAVGFPVALKVDDPLIPHKARVGCLALGLHDESAVAAAFDEIVANAAHIVGSRAVRAVVVEQQVPDGADLFAGVIGSADLGAVLVAGVGGAVVEAGLAVTAIRLPIDLPAAEEALRAAGLDAVVAAATGHPGAWRPLADSLVSVSRLAMALGSSLRAIDVNPLRVLVRGGTASVLALDALVEVAPSLGPATGYTSTIRP